MLIDERRFGNTDSEANEDTSVDFNQLTKEEEELYVEKKHDYVGSGDPFGNFNRIANILSNYPELKPYHPLFVGMMKILNHVDCVLDSLANNRVPNESLQTRLRDVSVLAKLMIIMLDRSADIFPLEGMGEEEVADDIEDTNDEGNDSSDENDEANDDSKEGEGYSEDDYENESEDEWD